MFNLSKMVIFLMRLSTCLYITNKYKQTNKVMNINVYTHA